ncbi:hypothetical protein M5K25_012665 [Dendrobium thyrsiflorum]|uniref:[histone H3]-lysine(27) N-methyltransferase n=1 Tax=Dendrobium thyrsiflorum TaxID=117978 RepID=A0ABD0V4G2_DENTH
MTPVKSFMTVNLGEGARVQFPQTVLNTGYAGAIIQFGIIFEVMQFQQFLPENDVSVPTVKGAAKKPTVEAVNEKAPKRASVFTRPSIPSAPAPTVQKEISDPKLKPAIVNSTGQNIIPEEAPEEYTIEIPDASPKLSRKARRKVNAHLRANGWIPNTLQEPSPQLEANVPNKNDFEPLKWVKRNDDNGQLKKSFWEISRQQPLPPKKKESASSKIYKILKAVKDRNLQRRLRKSVNEVISSNVARLQNNKFSTKSYGEEFKRPPYYREPRKFCPNMGRYPYYGRKQLGEPSDSLYTMAIIENMIKEDPDKGIMKLAIQRHIPMLVVIGRKRRRRSIFLGCQKKKRRLVAFSPSKDPNQRLVQMASLATALTSLKMEFSNDLTYIPGMASSSANAAILEKGGMQVLAREDKETVELCRSMYMRGECPPLVVVFDSCEGFTVHADEDIKDMTFISEYTGDVDYLRKREHDDCDSMMTLLLSTNPFHSLVICPDKRGNIARFISGINNHTPEGMKKQNIKCVRYDVDGQCRVLLVACRDISRGERLYYDYNGYEQEYPTEYFL